MKEKKRQNNWKKEKRSASLFLHQKNLVLVGRSHCSYFVQLYTKTVAGQEALGQGSTLHTGSYERHNTPQPHATGAATPHITC